MARISRREVHGQIGPLAFSVSTSYVETMTTDELESRLEWIDDMVDSLFLGASKEASVPEAALLVSAVSQATMAAMAIETELRRRVDAGEDDAGDEGEE